MAYDKDDADTKKAVAAAVAVAVKEAVKDAVEEEVAGLKAKNTELLGKLRKATKDAEIDPADHQALQNELEASESALKESTKALKIATAESEKVKKQYEDESKVAHNLLVDNGLSTALIAAGIKDADYLDAAKSMLTGQVVLEANGEERVAKIGDKPLAEFVKTWAESDKGKKFVSAPTNTGSNATGGTHTVGDDDIAKIKSPAARLNAINTKSAAE